MQSPRLLALAGTVAVAAAVLIFGFLHVSGPTAAISPWRRTVSQYALTEGAPAFNTAVLLVAAGSVATILALLRTGLLRLRSGGTVALVLWSAALAAVVYFPKHNWAVGPSTDGTVHRFASVVAFLSLPVAALLIGRAWRSSGRWRVEARWTWGLGLWSLLCFTPIVGAIVAQPWTGVAWWRLIPLGAVERVLLVSEVGIILVLAWWASRAARAAAERPGGTTAGSGRPPAT